MEHHLRFPGEKGALQFFQVSDITGDGNNFALEGADLKKARDSATPP
jgi:hypothetical protein